MKKILVLMIIVLSFSLLITGCGLLQGPQQKSSADSRAKEVKLGYVQWASAEASTHLIAEVLERVGYDVKTSTLQAGALYAGVAKGDLDALVCAWLPQTQKSYWDKYSEQLVDLGANFNNAKLGLVVPKYVEADSIAELKDNANKFNKEIVGIDPGAGIMGVTKKKTMPNYGLEDWKLIKSSGPAMTASLKKAINKKKPIVVTGWTPHWKWAEFDLKFLKDPKKSYGKAETIRSIGHKNIKQDLPKVSKILENYDITTQQLGKIMNMIHQGKSPKEAAKQFIDNNIDLVNQWLPEGKQIKQ